MNRSLIAYVILAAILVISAIVSLHADSPYWFEYGEPEPRERTSFSLKLWGGVFDVTASEVKITDKVNKIKDVEEDLTENFWAFGLNISDVPVFPSAKTGMGKWFSAGIDLFNLNGGYTITTLLSDKVSYQKNEIFSKSTCLVGHVKISPFIESNVQPYVGFGFGPAYTSLEYSRVTKLPGSAAVLENDRNWDNSNFKEVFTGCDVYLGSRFSINLEFRLLSLINDHLMFEDPNYNKHTTNVKTNLYGIMSVFGFGLHF
ncbi:MAG: hypothetical protein HY811_08220 [Planctomycetes bacterium]|nr:hypothetical protein [Planctomycetota bacterium]